MVKSKCAHVNENQTECTHLPLHIHRNTQKQRPVESQLQNVVPVMRLSHRLAGEKEMNVFHFTDRTDLKAQSVIQ